MKAMKKLAVWRSEREHYIAEACVVWCFDARFTGALNVFAASNGFKNFDLIKIAGGAKTLASPAQEPDREFVLEQIKTSVRLHRAARIVLMCHADCGAYGGSSAFKNDAVLEKEFCAQELAKAERYLEKNLPHNVTIELIFVDFDGVWEIK